jgi:predicted nucleic acid-binding protein
MDRRGIRHGSLAEAGRSALTVRLPWRNLHPRSRRSRSLGRPGFSSAVYELDDCAIATAVKTLLKHKDLIREGADVVANALERFRERPALDFSDCLLLAVARKFGHLPLGTFDGVLDRLEGAVGL